MVWFGKSAKTFLTKTESLHRDNLEKILSNEINHFMRSVPQEERNAKIVIDVLLHLLARISVNHSFPLELVEKMASFLKEYYKHIQESLEKQF